MVWVGLSTNLKEAASGSGGESLMANNCVHHASRGACVAPFVVTNCSDTNESYGQGHAGRVNASPPRSRALFTRIVLALMFVTMSAAYLCAQTSGSVSGHVSDPTGAVIPDTNVTLTNVGTGASSLPQSPPARATTFSPTFRQESITLKPPTRASRPQRAKTLNCWCSKRCARTSQWR